MFSSKCWSWNLAFRINLWLNLPFVSMISKSMWLFVRPGNRILSEAKRSGAVVRGQAQDTGGEREEEETHLPVYSSYSVHAIDQTSSEQSYGNPRTAIQHRPPPLVSPPHREKKRGQSPR